MNRRTMIGVVMGAALMPMVATARQATPDTDQVERNKETVRRYYDAALAIGGDPNALDDIVSPNYTSADPQNAPGLEAFKARVEDAQRSIASLFTAYAWVIDDQIGVGDIVTSRVHLEVTTNDGKQGKISGLEWTEFDADGLMVRTYAEVDPTKLTELLYG